MVWWGPILECYDIVAGLNRCYAFANRLNNPGAFVTKDDREGALRILAG